MHIYSHNLWKLSPTVILETQESSRWREPDDRYGEVGMRPYFEGATILFLKQNGYFSNNCQPRS